MIPTTADGLSSRTGVTALIERFLGDRGLDADSSTIPDEVAFSVGFVHDGTRILNPLTDTTSMYSVDPVETYGADCILQWVAAAARAPFALACQECGGYTTMHGLTSAGGDDICESCYSPTPGEVHLRSLFLNVIGEEPALKTEWCNDGPAIKVFHPDGDFYTLITYDDNGFRLRAGNAMFVATGEVRMWEAREYVEIELPNVSVPLRPNNAWIMASHICLNFMRFGDLP
jgi:hypothetical protein